MVGFLLAATGIVASLFGPSALESGGDVVEILALVALAGGLLCGVLVLRPISDTEPASIERRPVTRLSEVERKQVAWRGNVPARGASRPLDTRAALTRSLSGGAMSVQRC